MIAFSVSRARGLSYTAKRALTHPGYSMVHTFEDLYLRHIEHMVPRARDTSISSLAALTTVYIASWACQQNR